MEAGSRSSRLKVERVVLTGFMGAGKSTVGQLLAPLLGWTFLDTDALLLVSTGHSISQLFSLHQESGFRALEAAEVHRALQRQQVVIALGGGALDVAATRASIAGSPTTLLVYLETPLHVSLARCAGEPGAAVRPLLQDRLSLEQRFHARLPAYQAADRTLRTDRHTAQQIAESLAAELLTSF